jgi:hypothetical protein
MSRPQNRVKRFVKSITLTDAQRDTIDLPRDYDYESIVIRFSGTSTLSSAGSAVRAEAPLQAISWLNLKANGTDLLDGMSAVMAHRNCVLRNGQLPPLSAPSDATAAARTFSGMVVLDRAVIDGIRAKDGNFPSVGLSTFQLEVTAGNATDLFTGTPAGTMTMTVSVSIVQTEEVAVGGRRSLPRVVTKRSQRTESFASSNSAAQIRLNTGTIMRGLLLRAYGASTAGEPSNTGLNNVKVKKGNQILFDLPASTLQGMNQADFNVSTWPTGYYLVDFMTMGGPAGKLADCLDLRDGAELYLELDVTGATNQKVDIAQLEFMPYNPAYWGVAA